MFKSLAFYLLSVGLVLGSSDSSDSSDGGDGSKPSDPTSMDGTYKFTCLSEKLRINVCTNEDRKTYMSLTVDRDLDGCNNREDFVLGVFRDLNGPQKIDDDILALLMVGFQTPQSGVDFMEMAYKIECDGNKCILSRNAGLETFVLDKISNTVLGNCFEPGGRFDGISFPAEYISADLKGCGICQAPEDSCFERQKTDSVNLLNTCYAIFKEGEAIPFEGGPIMSQSREWEEELSLETFEDDSLVEGANCKRGTQITILDPKNVDKGRLVISWRCSEGNVGFTYTLDQTNIGGGSSLTCPMYT